MKADKEGMISPDEVSRMIRRITSYNVCYTKLLRMKNVVERYKPAIIRGEDVKRGETIRNYVYNIAADLNCIIGAEPKNYTTEFFYINEKDCTITFKVRKTVFFGSSSEKKNEELEKIAEHIKNCVNTRFAAGKRNNFV